MTLLPRVARRLTGERFLLGAGWPVHAALAAGVAGYELKTDSLFAVVEAIRAGVQSQPWYSPRIQGEVRAWLRGGAWLRRALSAI